jgi:hypothetical protein
MKKRRFKVVEEKVFSKKRRFKVVEEKVRFYYPS